MEYLHTMVRVNDIDKSLDFYCDKLGLVEISRYDSEHPVMSSKPKRSAHRWWS